MKVIGCNSHRRNPQASNHPREVQDPTDRDNGGIELDERVSPPAQATPVPSRHRPNPYKSLPFVRDCRQIRVFDLDGAYLHWDTSRIKGNLRLVDLDDNPVFTALSYVWGDYSSPARDTIDCNGCEIEVTRNCLSALRHLRKVFGAITIWIDAICINQAETSEKAYQIPLMGQVYSSAQTVYAWLGDGNKKSDRVMEWLARGSRIVRLFAYDHAAFHEARLPTGSLASLRLALYFYLGLTANLYTRTRYSAGLKDILSRPWIRRLWTLQEAVLPHQLEIICGTKVTPWLSFIRGLEHMEMSQVILPELERWCSLKDTWRRYHQGARLASMDADDLEDNRPPLGEYDTYRMSTAAKDRFFGVYGFIHRNQRGRKMMPDYSYTTLDILYRLLFKQVVRYTDSLDILLFTPSRIPRAPTWVVDWRSLSASWFRSLRGFPGATPESKAQCKFVGTKKLLVRARIVSRVVYSTTTIPADALHYSGDAAAVFIHAAAELDYKVVARNLLSDGQTGVWHVARLMGLRTRFWKFIVPKIRKQFKSEWGMPVGIMRYYFWGSRFSDIIGVLTRNRMSLVRCSSETMSDFGYASEETREGDLVALISGVSLPMILREKERRPGQYEVVGPAFFGSAMEGEVWQRINRDNLDELVLV